MASRIAVAGLGARGREWVREVSAHAGFELAACVDVDPDARAVVQRELGLGPGALHADLEAVVGDVDAVVVATPPQHHVAACRAAVDRGVAVLVEKPFTLGLEAALELADLAERRATPLLVAQGYRYLRSQRTARAVVRSGRLGAIRQVECRHYRSDADPAIEVQNPTLWDLGVHHLDAIRDLLGDEPRALLASGFDDGSSVHVLIEFAHGTRASYSATRRSSGHEFFEGGQEHYMRVVGERGTLHVLQRWLVLCETGRLPRPLRRGPRKQTEDAQLLDALAAAMRGEGSRGLGARENIATMAILDACVRSDAGHCWIPLDA